MMICEINKHGIIQVTSILLLCLCVHCDSKSSFKKKIVVDEKNLEASAIIRHFLANNYDNNRLTWELKGEKAYFSESQQDTLIFKPRLKYWGKKLKKGNTFIRSEEGEYTESNKILYLKNNVLVRSPNGKTILTEYLYWYQKKEMIKTNAPVKIIMPGGNIIRGVGLEADMKLDKITLLETIGEARFK